MIRMTNVWILCAVMVTSVGHAEEKAGDVPLKSVHLLNLPEGVTESQVNAVIADVNRAIAAIGYPESGYRLWKVKLSSEKMDRQYLWEGNWPSQAGYDAIHKHDAYKAAWKPHAEVVKKLSGHLYIRYTEVPTHAKDKTADRPKTCPVTGTVTLDGQPVEGATVSFYKVDGEWKAVGVTDAQGRYTLSTFEAEDGAPAGQYTVTIAKHDPPKDLLPSKYADPRTSGLTAWVSESGINQFSFELISR